MQLRKKRIEQIVGTFLYYAQAVDLTILMALSAITSQCLMFSQIVFHLNSL